MKLSSEQRNALSDFCDIILCGHNEDAFQCCVRCFENDPDETTAAESVLYVLSGFEIDGTKVTEPQFYLVSTDSGAPELEDFFWFVDNIKKSRGLSFTLDSEKFSESCCIDTWLSELANQLNDLYIVSFDGVSEDFHFTIMNKDDSIKAMELFGRFTANIAGYEHSSSIFAHLD